MNETMIMVAGSDYSRKIPTIGPKFVWENMHVTVPLLLMYSEDSESGFFLDASKCADRVLCELYKLKFSNHVDSECSTFDEVYNEIQRSRLAQKTKNMFPCTEDLISTIKNINWIIEYWSLTNASPPTSTDGVHGFIKVQGKLQFGIST